MPEPKFRFMGLNINVEVSLQHRAPALGCFVPWALIGSCNESYFAKAATRFNNSCSVGMSRKGPSRPHQAPERHCSFSPVSREDKVTPVGFYSYILHCDFYSVRPQSGGLVDLVVSMQITK